MRLIACVLALVLPGSAVAPVPQSAALFPVSQGGKFGFIDRSGAIVIAPQFDGAGRFSDGLALVRTGADHAYVNASGTVVIRLKYSDFNLASDFSEGLAVVGNRGPGDAIEEQLGYIDKSGKLVIPLQFDQARAFSEGLAVVSLRGKGRGFIDRTGTFVIAPRYGLAESFSGGVARVGSYVQGLPQEHFIDRTGARAIQQQFRFIDDFSEGLAAVWIGDGKGYIDRTGAVVLKPQPFNFAAAFSDGLARVQIGGPMGKGGKLGFIDRTGTVVVKPQYDFAADFSEGLCAVSIDGKYGFIDKTGVVVIPPRFGAADPFTNGLARVWFDNRMGYIDQTGKVIWSGDR